MDLAHQLNTALAGRYEIEREIGAGGMATVYLARDLRHNRKVALKVLRPELGAVLGPERFLSEINVTANLQHPHLLPLFDSGEAEGHLFYVMPYVEGETLRQRLERERQLSVEEAVRIGAAVASALDYAHRHNVIHRDLKPENILLHEGQPLVTDFGIALAVSVAGGARITQTGLSLGTPQYMSPEQATGDRQIDARSDIYSLAAVVYEMLVGDPPHMAGTVQAVIAKVLTERPHNVRLYRETVPEHLDAAVMRGLAKLPADRFATAGEFADALTGARPLNATWAAPPVQRDAPEWERGPAPAARRRRVTTSLLTLAGGALLGAVIGAVLFPRRPPPSGSPSLFEVTFSDTVAHSLVAGGPEVAISPDGSQLAFVGMAGGVGGIFLRRMGGFEARLVRATEDGIAPSFSPDGTSLLFLAEGELRKVPLTGGSAITVVQTASAGASWGDRGEIIYGRGALWRVPADGGAPTLLASPDSQRQQIQYRWPHLLPGGEAALITLWKGDADVNPANAELGVVTIPGGEVTELGIRGTNPHYARSGHIVFARSDGSVFAAPFSLRRRRLTGPVVPVLEGVSVKLGGAVNMAISDNGTVVYGTDRGVARGRLVRVTRSGEVTPLVDEIHGYLLPRISPDGRRIAVTITGGTGGGGMDIWTYDLPSRTLTRLTTSGYGWDPQWSRDGQRIVYTLRSGRSRIVWQPWDGGGAPEGMIARDAAVWDISIGPPSTYLAVREDGPGGTRDILIAPADSPQALRPFLATPAVELMPRISPDGRLLAYASDESGRLEVYARPIPGPGGRVQVSTGGGQDPAWSPDGREVFYRGPSHLMAATLSRSPELAIARRDTLFADTYARQPLHVNYDVFPDGDFVMVQEVAGGAGRIFAIVNWFEELRRRTAGGGASR